VSSFVGPVLWSLPWVLAPALAVMRARHSRWLDDVSADVPTDAPLVSVVIPARNERRNIERCVASVLASRYERIDVIVVDDHSTDGTGDAARAIGAGDPRLRVIEAPDLPSGWFGKQWACATGAAAARGDLLLFTDADTRHGDDLLPRAVNAMRAGHADLLTVAGHQEMHSFWERVIQPQLFAMLALRFGGTEHVSHARRAEDVIANGQFILFRRDAYDALGGHELVRDQVAEDLALAQEFHRSGRRILLFIATQQFSTHMYASLAELVAGWRKNIYAGGRYAALGGSVGRALYPIVLVGVPLLGVVPPVMFVLSLLGVLSASWLVWSSIVVAVTLVFFAAIYRFSGESMWYALAYPLGFGALFYIALGAVARGRRVSWKERTYVAR
jgi:chlorobactene glucosyltransferase